MTDTETFSKELLKKAIVAEIDGQRFYKSLAGKASNDDAKRKLNNLAQDEMRHEEILYRIYKDVHGVDVDDLPQNGMGVLTKFFEENKDRKDQNEMQYIDLAIEAELAATNYYKDGAKNAPNEDIRKICESMASEEFRHYESLKAEKEALSGNYYWFGFGEGAPLED